MATILKLVMLGVVMVIFVSTNCALGTDNPAARAPIAPTSTTTSPQPGAPTAANAPGTLDEISSGTSTPTGLPDQTSPGAEGEDSGAPVPQKTPKLKLWGD